MHFQDVHKASFLKYVYCETFLRCLVNTYYRTPIVLIIRPLNTLFTKLQSAFLANLQTSGHVVEYSFSLSLHLFAVHLLAI